MSASLLLWFLVALLRSLLLCGRMHARSRGSSCLCVSEPVPVSCRVLVSFLVFVCFGLPLCRFEFARFVFFLFARSLHLASSLLNFYSFFVCACLCCYLCVSCVGAFFVGFTSQPNSQAAKQLLVFF